MDTVDADHTTPPSVEEHENNEAHQGPCAPLLRLQEAQKKTEDTQAVVLQELRILTGRVGDLSHQVKRANGHLARGAAGVASLVTMAGYEVGPDAFRQVFHVVQPLAEALFHRLLGG